MRWFGRSGGAPYEEDSPHCETPVGSLCAWCAEPFGAKDDGVLVPCMDEAGTTELAYHYECQLRQFIGGPNHLRNRCTCCGGTEPPDPPWLTRRQAAQQAVDVWHSLGQRQRS